MQMDSLVSADIFPLHEINKLHNAVKDLEMRSYFLKYTGKWASSTHESPY